MKKLIRELQKEIKKEASKEDFDAEKMIDLLNAYQILKKYQNGKNNDDDTGPIPKLIDLDFEIIKYIGNNGQSALKNIYPKLMLSKSTVSYHIEYLIEKGILIKIPTVVKDKPIDLTDKGKEIFLMIKKEEEDKTGG
jgi:DNA-binding MarR family transcriptional regulator